MILTAHDARHERMPSSLPARRGAWNVDGDPPVDAEIYLSRIMPARVFSKPHLPR
jgi:hypothetical protein